MFKKIVATATALCIASGCGISVNAAENITEQASSSTSVYSLGLISSGLVSISNSGNNLYLSGFTNCSNVMKKVGIIDIRIQQSSNNSDWSNYSSYGDMVKENSAYFSCSNAYIGTVQGGYYYRVVCKHYAKESGLFGRTEKDEDISYSIYVP